MSQGPNDIPRVAGSQTGCVERPVRFFHRGRVVEVTGADTTRTLLDWLREDVRCTGTKEGCAEGDCGACTVLVGGGRGDGVAWRNVNACIQFLPMLDGKALLTVDDLRPACGGARMHPVQQALVDCHGSQCGFCTPGFVMSMVQVYGATPRAPRCRRDSSLPTTWRATCAAAPATGPSWTPPSGCSNCRPASWTRPLWLPRWPRWPPTRPWR
jgi:xanthine dehydrogenase iron-sulfur cluster and FAD-binding subunit A